MHVYWSNAGNFKCPNNAFKKNQAILATVHGVRITTDFRQYFMEVDKKTG